MAALAIPKSHGYQRRSWTSVRLGFLWITKASAERAKANRATACATNTVLVWCIQNDRVHHLPQSMRSLTRYVGAPTGSAACA